MKNAIDAADVKNDEGGYNNTDNIRRLLEIDVYGRFLADKEIVDKVTECKNPETLRLFQEKRKICNTRRTEWLYKVIKNNQDKQLHQLLTHVEPEDWGGGWKLLKSGPSREQKELAQHDKTALQDLKSFIVENVIKKRKPEIIKVLVEFFPALRNDLFRGFGITVESEALMPVSDFHSWMRTLPEPGPVLDGVTTFSLQPLKRKENDVAAEAGKRFRQ